MIIPMLLIDLPNYIKCNKIYNFHNKKIIFNFVTTYSKQVKKKSIFILSNQFKLNKKYINEAVSKGAVAIITQQIYKIH